MATSARNDLVVGDRIVASTEHYVARLGEAIPTIARHLNSPLAATEIRLELDDRPGFLVYVKPIPGGYRIRVPRGLVLRLIALLRLLLPYYAETRTPYMLASPLDRFSPEAFHTPRPVAPIFEDFDDVAALRTAFADIEFPRALESAY